MGGLKTLLVGATALPVLATGGVAVAEGPAPTAGPAPQSTGVRAPVDSTLTFRDIAGMSRGDLRKNTTPLRPSTWSTGAVDYHVDLNFGPQTIATYWTTVTWQFDGKTVQNANVSTRSNVNFPYCVKDEHDIADFYGSNNVDYTTVRQLDVGQWLPPPFPGCGTSVGTITINLTVGNNGSYRVN